MCPLVRNKSNIETLHETRLKGLKDYNGYLSKEKRMA